MASVTTTRPIHAPDLPFDVPTLPATMFASLGRSNVCRVFERGELPVHEFFLSVRVWVSIFSAISSLLMIFEKFRSVNIDSKKEKSFTRQEKRRALVKQ